MYLAKAAECLPGQSVQLKLLSPNLVIDERCNFPRNCKFNFIYDAGGTAVTLVRTDCVGWQDGPFTFRVYDPKTESLPKFESMYTYMGIEGERAPREATLIIIDPSVEIIRERAFEECFLLEKCFMHDGVEMIEDGAFRRCSAMSMIRLSRSLKTIGFEAFHSCEALQSIFIPPSITNIGNDAFGLCTNIRTLSLPHNLTISNIGYDAFYRCDTFLEIAKIQNYTGCERESENFLEVHQSMLDFYRKAPTMHRECLNTTVTARSIMDCVNEHGAAVAAITDHDEMTPLHILAMNPHTDEGAILACFHANIHAVLTVDAKNRTPLDYLMAFGDLEVRTSLITALCVHRNIILE